MAIMAINNVINGLLLLITAKSASYTGSIMPEWLNGSLLPILAVIGTTK